MYVYTVYSFGCGGRRLQWLILEAGLGIVPELTSGSLHQYSSHVSIWNPALLSGRGTGRPRGLRLAAGAFHPVCQTRLAVAPVDWTRENCVDRGLGLGVPAGRVVSLSVLPGDRGSTAGEATSGSRRAGGRRLDWKNSVPFIYIYENPQMNSRPPYKDADIRRTNALVILTIVTLKMH